MYWREELLYDVYQTLIYRNFTLKVHNKSWCGTSDITQLQIMKHYASSDVH